MVSVVDLVLKHVISFGQLYIIRNVVFYFDIFRQYQEKDFTDREKIKHKSRGWDVHLWGTEKYLGAVNNDQYE